MVEGRFASCSRSWVSSALGNLDTTDSCCIVRCLIGDRPGVDGGVFLVTASADFERMTNMPHLPYDGKKLSYVHFEMKVGVSGATIQRSERR